MARKLIDEMLESNTPSHLSEEERCQLDLALQYSLHCRGEFGIPGTESPNYESIMEAVDIAQCGRNLQKPYWSVLEQQTVTDIVTTGIAKKSHSSLFQIEIETQDKCKKIFGELHMTMEFDETRKLLVVKVDDLYPNDQNKDAQLHRELFRRIYDTVNDKKESLPDLFSQVDQLVIWHSCVVNPLSEFAMRYRKYEQDRLKQTLLLSGTPNVYYSIKFAKSVNGLFEISRCNTNERDIVCLFEKNL